MVQALVADSIKAPLFFIFAVKNTCFSKNNAKRHYAMNKNLFI